MRPYRYETSLAQNPSSLAGSPLSSFCIFVFVFITLFPDKLVQTDRIKDIQQAVDRIKILLHRNNIHSSTIQVEILDLCDAMVNFSSSVKLDILVRKISVKNAAAP